MKNEWAVTAMMKLLAGLTKAEVQDVFDTFNRQTGNDLPNAALCPKFPNQGRRKKLSKIDANPKLAAFLKSLPYMSIENQIEACKAKFGKKASPSRSSLHRWLQSTTVQR